MRRLDMLVRVRSDFDTLMAQLAANPPTGKRRWPTAKRLWPVYAVERMAERLGRRDLANRIYAHGVTRGRP